MNQRRLLAIKEGTPITAITPYVEDLNYLQCAWARAAIYSNRRDFGFAKRVFRENPQCRGFPRTMLETRNVLVPDNFSTQWDFDKGRPASTR